MTKIDQERIRREYMRWLILLALNHARPYGTVESVLVATLQAVYQDATGLEVRQHLDYLSDRDLVDLDKRPSGTWAADLTSKGTDIAEYTIDCEPGIARPQKYW
ncbi:hypothetical protein [Lysobacter sp. CA199]|uniref:hypothetical protein n=1 Tax=Lysobacter sp. CA199 TaxID=3455608 RepID=UPI003F8D4FB8